MRTAVTLHAPRPIAAIRGWVRRRRQTPLEREMGAFQADLEAREVRIKSSADLRAEADIWDRHGKRALADVLRFAADHLDKQAVSEASVKSIATSAFTPDTVIIDDPPRNFGMDLYRRVLDNHWREERLARSPILAEIPGTAAHGRRIGHFIAPGATYLPVTDRELRFTRASLRRRGLDLEHHHVGGVWRVVSVDPGRDLDTGLRTSMVTLHAEGYNDFWLEA